MKERQTAAQLFCHVRVGQLHGPVDSMGSFFPFALPSRRLDTPPSRPARMLLFRSSVRQI